MAKEYAKAFYNSAKWKKCRNAYVAKVFGICEWCNGAGYICDHIEPITPENISDPDITLNHDNLQYLCLTCHNRKTFGDSDTREDVTFDEEGNLVRR